jgi:hypothetical protein
MSYIINHFSGSQLAVVPDGTVDQSTSLKLIGKNYVGYGEAQNENFAYLLENFASPTAPSRPVPGQLWFNSNLKIISVYNGTAWKQIGLADIASEPPVGAANGQFWFNTSTQQTFIKAGDSYNLIGPEVAPGFGITRAVSTTIRDTDSNVKPIIKLLIDNTVIAIVSKTSFTILNDDYISGFNLLTAGITLCNQFNIKGNIEGNADSATKLATARNINGVAFDGTANIDITVSGNLLTGNTLASTIVNSNLTSVGTLANLTVTNTIVGSVNGNAATATKLAATKNINGVAFDGSANITIFDSTKLPLTGGVLTGDLTLRGDPIDNSHAATKKYVDDRVGSITLVPQGLITLWHGILGNIPAGWAICDGTRGTPDLRDRFIIGAGNLYPVGNTGGTKDAVVVDHTHTASFTGTPLPNHTHGITDAGHAHAQAGYNLNNDPAGALPFYNWANTHKATNVTQTGSATTGITVNPITAGTPSGSVTVNNPVGGVSGTDKNLPPYYALAYIMKL